jgi:hypothetical protein
VSRVRGPSSEADLARGGAEPSSEADLARGGVQPYCSGGPRGPPGSWRVCVLASWISLRFAFFTKLSGFSPVHYGTPRAVPTVAPERLWGIRRDPADVGTS